MKKIVLTAAVFALTLSTAFSQEFKPKEKEIAVGIAFDSPFSAAKPFSLVDGGLSARYFYKSDLAFRGSLKIKSESDSKTSYGRLLPTDDEKAYLTNDNTVFNVNLSLGAEKHFSGTDRLDPYVGADILLGFGSDSHKSSINDDAIAKSLLQTVNLSRDQSNSSLGLRLVVGADYYILSKVYVGTEFGFSYTRTSFGDSKDVVKTLSDNTEKTTTKKGDSFVSNSNILTEMTTGSFRIGFRF
jgi:hypothetical protein